MRRRKPKWISNKSIDWVVQIVNEIMTFLRTARNSIGCLLLAGTLAFLIGCGTAATSKSANSTALTKPADNTPPPYDPLRIGDRISVEFSGAPTALPPVQTDIKSDGTIRLDFVG